MTFTTFAYRATLALIWALAIYHSWACRGLFVDGSGFLIQIVGGMLDEAPLWKARNERRLAARALWSAVHGVVITNFSAGEEEAARARTSQLLNVLLGVIVEGMFAKHANA